MTTQPTLIFRAVDGRRTWQDQAFFEGVSADDIQRAADMVERSRACINDEECAGILKDAAELLGEEYVLTVTDKNSATCTCGCYGCEQGPYMGTYVTLDNFGFEWISYFHAFREGEEGSMAIGDTAPWDDSCHKNE